MEHQDAPTAEALAPVDPMTEKLQEITDLLNNGEGEKALLAWNLADLSDLPRSPMQELALKVLRADALRVAGHYPQAASLYRSLAYEGDTYAAQLWRRAGECLLNCQKIDEAVLCVRRSLSIDGTDQLAHALAARLLFSSTLFLQGCSHAHFLLKHCEWDEALVTAENIFRFSQMPSEAYEVVKRRAEIAADYDFFLGLLTCGAQGICDWGPAEEYARQLESRFYSKGDFATSREIPLYNIARSSDEAVNLAVARVSMEDINQLQPAFDLSGHVWKEKLRVGFLSADFAAHPVIMLTIGLFEQLAQSMEIYAYDDGMKESGEQFTRFKNVVTRHVDVRERSDQDVAAMAHGDGVDILIDLMGLTTKNRIGVLALRPCPVTATFLGFPGSSGVSAVDYVITDKIITPDSSKPHYAEKLCRLPEVFMPQDDKRPVASNPVCRADVGLPEDAFVFCSFNRSFKLDRQSVELWMRILARTPGSVLWQKADEENMQRVFRNAAIAHGVDPARIVFAGNAASVALHLSRSGLADLALDTLIYNGHTITADMLWAGVPVITRLGSHFASRVSASLLSALGLPELVAPTLQDMEDLAVALALNPARMADLRNRLRRRVCESPLFDTARYSVHFAAALHMMADRAKQGLPPDHLDVPSLPPRSEAFLPDGPPRHEETQSATPENQPYADTGKDLAMQKTPWLHQLGICPLCNAPSPGQGYPLYWAEEAGVPAPLPAAQIWVPCPKCGHVYAMAFWSEEARRMLENREWPPLAPESFAVRKQGWLPLVRRAQELLPEERRPGLYRSDSVWLDVGAGDGTLALTAQTAGFQVSLMDRDPHSAASLEKLLSVTTHDFISATFAGKADVLSLCGLLEENPYPDIILRKAKNCLRPGGVLMVGFVDCNGPIWALNQAFDPHNPALHNPKRLHLFTRAEIEELLRVNGFAPKHTVEPDGSSGGLFLFATPRADI